MVQTIKVEVIHATQQQQTILQMVLPINSCIRDAIMHSQLPITIDEHLVVGIFGKQRSLEFTLEDGDRVEIYRPLNIDPKLARIARVKRDRRHKSKSVRISS